MWFSVLIFVLLQYEGLEGLCDAQLAILEEQKQLNQFVESADSAPGASKRCASLTRLRCREEEERVHPLRQEEERIYSLR